MIGLPAETRVWLASGATDMRRGFDGLALLVQETLKRDPHCGHLFVFRGKRGGLIKLVQFTAVLYDYSLVLYGGILLLVSIRFQP